MAELLFIDVPKHRKIGELHTLSPRCSVHFVFLTVMPSANLSPEVTSHSVVSVLPTSRAKFVGSSGAVNVKAPPGGSVIADCGADKPVAHCITEMNDMKLFGWGQLLVLLPFKRNLRHHAWRHWHAFHFVRVYENASFSNVPNSLKPQKLGIEPFSKLNGGSVHRSTYDGTVNN